MADAWMGAMTEVEDSAVADHEVPTKKRPLSRPTRLEHWNSQLQQNYLFKNDQCSCSNHLLVRPHRTTQQRLRQRPEDEELRNRTEQDHIADQQTIAQWEAQHYAQAQ